MTRPDRRRRVSASYSLSCRETPAVSAQSIREMFQVILDAVVAHALEPDWRDCYASVDDLASHSRSLDSRSPCAGARRRADIQGPGKVPLDETRQGRQLPRSPSSRWSSQSRSWKGCGPSPAPERDRSQMQLTAVRTLAGSPVPGRREAVGCQRDNDKQTGADGRDWNLSRRPGTQHRSKRPARYGARLQAAGRHGRQPQPNRISVTWPAPYPVTSRRFASWKSPPSRARHGGSVGIVWQQRSRHVPTSTTPKPIWTRPKPRTSGRWRWSPRLPARTPRNRGINSYSVASIDYWATFAWHAATWPARWRSTNEHSRFLISPSTALKTSASVPSRISGWVMPAVRLDSSRRHVSTTRWPRVDCGNIVENVGDRRDSLRDAALGLARVGARQAVQRTMQPTTFGKR